MVWYSRLDIDEDTKLYDALQPKKAVKRRHKDIAKARQRTSCQNVQAQASDKRAESTYQDAEAVLHEALQIQEHLLAQNQELQRLRRRDRDHVALVRVHRAAQAGMFWPTDGSAWLTECVRVRWR